MASRGAASATAVAVGSSDSTHIATRSKSSPDLERLLKRLRPFQREAYDFATQGKMSMRQWSSTNDSSSSTTTKDATNSTPFCPSATPGYHPDFLGKGRILLCDEMGLGKSITSLAIMMHYQDEWPLLILCPASLRYTWPAEIEKFLPALPASSVYVMQGFDDADVYDNVSKRKKVRIVVATYSLLQNRSAAARVLQDFNFQCVIADESHNLKQRKSQRTILALPWLQKAKRLVLLSGTPALARPVELWTQLYAVAPRLFAKYTPFTLRYCNAKRDRFGWNVNGLSHAEELHDKLKQIMVRRLKADVLHELPPKVRSIVPVSIPKGPKRTECQAVMKELRDTRQSVADLVGDEASGAHFEARRLMMVMYQASGIAKAPSVCEYVLDWLRGSGRQKVLVFAHHAAVMDAIEAAVAKELKGAGHIRIDGTVSASERALRVRKFQTSSQVRAAILSITAAGVGLTLTAASSVIFAELHWTPGVLAQAEDRAHRIGQVNSVNVSYLVCEDSELSLDMELWKMLSRKVSSLGKVIDGQRDASLKADRDVSGASGRSGMSVQDELTGFFAEASTMKDGKEPPKGSILSFFSKKKEKKVEGPGIEIPSSKPPPRRMMKWSCSACTYDNACEMSRSGWLACEICGTPSNLGEDGDDAVRLVTPGFARKVSATPSSASSKQGTKRHREPGYTKVETIVIDDRSDGDDEDKKHYSSGASNPIILCDSDTDETRPKTKKKHKAKSDGSSAFTHSRSSDSKPEHGLVSDVLAFSVSKNSGRVTIHYKVTGEPSLTNFSIDEILTSKSATSLMEARLVRCSESSLVPTLTYNVEAIRKLTASLDRRKIPKFCTFDDIVTEIQSFVNQYWFMREVEKKWLQESAKPYCGSNLRQQVLQQMPEATSNTTSRYIGGAKERARHNVESGTATCTDVAILEGRRCAYCGGTMSAATRREGVIATYCSRECTEQGRLKRGGMYSSNNVRQQVFALEGGVCQLCGVNAHSLYTRIVALEPSERLNTLCNASWKLPQSAKALERLLQKPTEGDFWQADHIRAVAEGGGGCDISNFRTLCVPCHIGETGKLRGRLKLSGGVQDNRSTSDSKRQTDIRSMFGGHIG